jgi:hypothetical protein
MRTKLKINMYKELRIKKIMMFSYVDKESNAVSFMKGKLNFTIILGEFQT